MHCKQFEARLHKLLDHRLPPDADSVMQTHAYQCRSCRMLLEYQSQLFAALDRHTVTRPSADFATRVVSRCTEINSPQEPTPVKTTLHPTTGQPPATIGKSPFQRHELLKWATVTAVVGLLLIPLTWSPRIKPGAHSRVVQRGHLQTTGQNKMQPFTTLLPSQQQTINNPDPIVAPHFLSTNPMTTDWLKNPESHVHQIGSWVGDLSRQSKAPLVELTGGLRPITSSFTVTWKAIRRAIPTVRSDTTQPSSPQSSVPSVTPTV